MRAITVMQPWAWAIMAGGKLVENRTMAWTYRGPLAIHAGNRDSARGWTSPLIWQAAKDSGAYSDMGPTIRGVHYGAILGLVDLVDVHPCAGCCQPWGESSYREHPSGRVRTQITHLVLENPRLLREPIACRGTLGLWHVPADITVRLEALDAKAESG
jgi:hypothetical protein